MMPELDAARDRPGAWVAERVRGTAEAGKPVEGGTEFKTNE